MTQTESRLPTPADAANIAADVLGVQIIAADRMPTGAGNWVFDVRCARGPNVVVRILRTHEECASGAYWSRTLRPLGVPLPEMLALTSAAAVTSGRGWCSSDCRARTSNTRTPG